MPRYRVLNMPRYRVNPTPYWIHPDKNMKKDDGDFFDFLSKNGFLVDRENYNGIPTVLYKDSHKRRIPVATIWQTEERIEGSDGLVGYAYKYNAKLNYIDGEEGNSQDADRLIYTLKLRKFLIANGIEFKDVPEKSKLIKILRSTADKVEKLMED